MVLHATELSCILLNSFYAAGLNACKLTILHFTALSQGRIQRSVMGGIEGLNFGQFFRK